MRLTSVKIKNFRSIVDTGWNKLAYDNITALIGQNESGKTSILEALDSFYSGEISENVLRSDMNMPEVSCGFEYIPEIFENKIEKKLLPEAFFELLGKKGYFTLTRKWIDEKNSRLLLDDDEIKEIYKSDLEKKKKREDQLKHEVNSITGKLKEINGEYEKLNAEKIIIEKDYNQSKFEFEKLESSFKRNQHDEEIKKIYEQSKEKIEIQKNELDKLSATCNEKSKIINSLAENAKYAGKCSELEILIVRQIKEIEMAGEDIKSSAEQKEFAVSSRKRRILQRKLDTLNKIVTEKRIQVENFEKELQFNLLIYEKIRDGQSLRIAEREAGDFLLLAQKFLTLDELGDLFFEEIPVFEFFEDFSSLLPDRIDLEDIITKNTNVEGYKAATNFLVISGLTSEFFNQKNNRILKQMIENLNSEININFHEYWQQKIGKENKIKINFELEHYDFQVPEKKGKPYLEFWIKDEKERLYPKQRSRGVRWFLSFYLELKAKAMDKKRNKMVLLIDEPGVSLHARAQEDVLKVFEDIRDFVQIIYTTHSPHLININKLYRILAVQRTKEDDDYSETIIFDAEDLNSASTDTLSPIYTLMGTRISEQQVIQKKNNVIIEDLATYYILSTFFKLLNITSDIYFLPATDVSNVSTLVNILLGWKLDYLIVLDDDDDGNRVYNELKKQLYGNDEDRTSKKIIMIDKCKSIEDLFSTIDFKKHVLHERVGITESNSEYIEENKLSRPVLASEFMTYVEDKKITLNDFDEETRNNIEWIANRIINALK